VLCAVTIPPADLRSLSLYYYAVCGRMCMSSVCGVLVCWWSADHQQTRTPNTHRWHTHAATCCVIIQTQRTQFSGRNTNGTKHSVGPPEDCREKRPKHIGVLSLFCSSPLCFSNALGSFVGCSQYIASLFIYVYILLYVTWWHIVKYTRI